MTISLSTYPSAASDSNQAQWRDFAQHWIGDGPLEGVTNELEVFGDSTGMQVKVKTGEAFIKGVWGELTSQTAIAIPTADPADPRIDLVVLRLNHDDGAAENHLLEVDVIEGTPAGSPTAPTVTSDSTQTEVALATVSVSAAASTIAAGDVTDARTLITPPGWLSQYQTKYDLVVYTANDTFAKADYPWARQIRVTVIGGGGAGGGAPATSAGEASMGAGGNSGAWATEKLDLATEVGTSETVTIGAAGTGSSGSAGGDGGDTSFGSAVSAGGGKGGPIRAASSTAFGVGPDSTAATATGGDVNVSGGQFGGPGFGSGQLGFSGAGGSTPWGSGGRSRHTTTSAQSLAGDPARGYGSGGGGAIASASASAAAGGNGRGGICIVELFG